MFLTVEHLKEEKANVKFILYVDYFARRDDHKEDIDLEYIDMEATNLADAMMEADRIRNIYTERNRIYLLKILQKKGRNYKEEGCKGLSFADYETVNTNRSHGWFGIPENENNITLRRVHSKFGSWIER